MELVNYSASAWSVVPALLALLLAIATRRVLLSLSIGILVGAIMLAGGNPLNGLSYLFNKVIGLVYDDGINFDSINIILFLILLGILTAILSISGSNQAFAHWAQKRIKGRRGAKLMAACLVFVTFIDDYFHSLAVGAIARPVTDKFHVSRAKLAYILDSTAAPMCVLMPVSSWGAYIITLIAGLLTTYGITNYTPLGAFIEMSAMNFYAIFAMILVFATAYFSIDLGSMAKFEQQALVQAHEDATQTENEEPIGRMRNLVLPMLTLIVATVAMMLYTGGQALAADEKAFTILGAFENTSVGKSLVVGGFSSIVVATLCILVTVGPKVSVVDYFKSYIVGTKSMLGAITILFFAWTINGIVKDMQTGTYLSTLVAGNINPAFLPAILFVLGAGMAFSTGTSWGTFGIMLPIAAAMAANAEPALLLPCLSAVMAGAVCGDHCSPISDTTILSSTGAQCNHMDHVTSQLPYALTVAIATFIGYLVLGFTLSALLAFGTTALVLAALIFVLKKKA